MYTITYAPEAKEGLAKLKRSEPASFKKAVKLLNEIAEHPKTGTGHPEPLKGNQGLYYGILSGDRGACGDTHCLRSLWGQIVSPFLFLLPS